jgi:beta-hydroxylase
MYYEAERFAFVTTLQDHWRVIYAELERLTSGNFLAWPERHLYGKGWDIFGLYAFGLRIEDNCRLCPETTKLVAQIPGLQTAGFSKLAPGAHITPHTGYPEGLLRCHLGLVVPGHCALRVGPEVRTWEPGRCLVFDDTTEHEAWNRSDRDRVVLLLDFKAPPGVLPGFEKSGERKTLLDSVRSLFGRKG